MAKTKPGIIPKISGSIGGTQFRDTRFGTVLALKGIPVNNRTTPKQKSTARFSNISRLWASVKPAQVAEWNKLADTIIVTDKLGNKYSMRGIDLFKQVNRTLVEINEPFNLSAPKKVFPKPLVSPEFEIIAPEKLIDIHLSFKRPISKDVKYIVYATPMLKYGRNSPKPSQYRIISVIDHTFLSGSSLLNDYKSVFKSNPQNTNRIGFKIKPVSVISGLASAEFTTLQIPND